MVLTADMARGRVALYLGKHAVEQNNIGVLSAQGLSGPDQPHPAFNCSPSGQRHQELSMTTTQSRQRPH